MCLKLARAVRRLHAAGLAHSDLSYKNVLVDPISGNSCIIDADELVVPGKYDAGVLGTPDFIAPEVMETKGLKIGDPNKKTSEYRNRPLCFSCAHIYVLAKSSSSARW